MTLHQTITEKILAKAAGRPSVSPGDYIVARPSVVVFMDFFSNVKWLADNNLDVWDADRVIFVFDHLHHAMAQHHAALRQFARERGIRVFDIGQHGLSHQVPAEAGYVLPGTLYLNADTQAPTMGALGCVALPGVGDTHVVAALGETWLKVPQSVKVDLTGTPPWGITGKEAFMRVMQVAGTENLIGKMVEFSGPGLQSLSVDFRMSLCNGTSTIGALSGIIVPDEKTLAYVTPRAREPFDVVTSDPNAEYAATFTVDLSMIEPLIGFPPDPSNVHPISEIEGLTIDQANIGSCSSARLDDLALAAEVVRERRVAPGVRFIVTPITSIVAAEAARTGILADLLVAGATVTTPGCGGCWAGNQSPALLADGEVCITSSVENVPGRMGSREASIYIAGAAVVAASAVEGRVTNPQRLLGRR
jgi:3-isopropylmalate/(R)-2-methylmalate dehydratase large subunit